MFTARIPEVTYADPWNLPLHERLAILAKGKRRVAYFYETANNSTFRYRAYNMAQVLNDADDGQVSASYFFFSDYHRIDEIADIADTLVICRSRYSHRINQLLNKFRMRDKRVLFDVDDLVFDTRYIHLIAHTLGQDLDAEEIWDYWFSYVARMGEALKMCDGAITTNNYLAARITEYSGLPTKVVPNFINKEQLNVSESLFQRKTESGFARDGRICLGYFSGSPSHNLDYAIVTSALEQLLENDDRIDIMVVGYIEPGLQFNRFGNRIKRQPFQDYVNLQRLLGSVEFNLMPLQSNTFTDCKSELKYFEAAIVGTVSIASPSYTYASAIQDGENGYLAYAHEWLSTVQRAIKNLNEYEQTARRAFEHARSTYAWNVQRGLILQALNFE